MRPHRTIEFAAATAIVAALAAVAAPARAEDNGPSLYELTVGKLLKGIGLKSSDEDKEINYRERPPLVIPSARNLPPPEQDTAIANPAWPKDPDVTRRKLEAKQQKNRPDRETERRDWEDPKLMTPEKLAPGPRPSGVANRNTAAPNSLGNMMSPSELGHKTGFLGNIFKGKDDDVARFTGEPPRAALTDPPQGYQTPSPNQPYGVTAAAPKAENNYEKRVEPVK